MEIKNKNIKKEKIDKNKTIKETYDEIISFVLQDNSDKKKISKVVNLDDFRNKKK